MDICFKKKDLHLQQYLLQTNLSGNLKCFNSMDKFRYFQIKFFLLLNRQIYV